MPHRFSRVLALLAAALLCLTPAGCGTPAAPPETPALEDHLFWLDAYIQKLNPFDDDGYATATLADGGVVLVDRAGRILTEGWDSIVARSQGYALVQHRERGGTGPWEYHGVVTLDGDMPVQLQADYLTFQALGQTHHVIDGRTVLIQQENGADLWLPEASTVAFTPGASAWDYAHGIRFVRTPHRWTIRRADGTEVPAQLPDLDLDIMPFVEGYAVVRSTGGLLGLLEEQTGQLTVPVAYSRVELLQNGLVGVSDNRQLQGVLDLQGNEVVPLHYSALYAGDRGFWVEEPGSLLGFVDLQGRIVAECIYRGFNTAGDLLLLRNERGLWCALDLQGNVRIEPVWAELRPLDTGELQARYPQDHPQHPGVWVVLDRDGAVVQHLGIDPDAAPNGGLPDHERVEDSGDGMTLAVRREQTVGRQSIYYYGFADDQGAEVVPTRYTLARAFQEGLAAVQTSRGTSLRPDRDGEDELWLSHTLWGFVDTAGAEVVEPRYDLVRDFSEGRAAVLVADNHGNVSVSTRNFNGSRWSPQNSYREPEGKWGFVDREGREVIPPVYDRVYSFSGGYAAVCLNGSWGYIDPDGDVALPCVYSEVSSIDERGLALVQRGERWAVLDLSRTRTDADRTPDTWLRPYERAEDAPEPETPPAYRSGDERAQPPAADYYHLPQPERLDARGWRLAPILEAYLADEPGGWYGSGGWSDDPSIDAYFPLGRYEGFGRNFKYPASPRYPSDTLSTGWSHTLEYSGIAFGSRFSGEVAAGLRVGMPLTEVVALLGSPHFDSADYRAIGYRTNRFYLAIVGTETAERIYVQRYLPLPAEYDDCLMQLYNEETREWDYPFLNFRDAYDYFGYAESPYGLRIHGDSYSLSADYAGQVPDAPGIQISDRHEAEAQLFDHIHWDWLLDSAPGSLSPDGTRVLFSSEASSGRYHNSTWLHTLDRSRPTRRMGHYYMGSYRWLTDRYLLYSDTTGTFIYDLEEDGFIDREAYVREVPDFVPEHPEWVIDNYHEAYYYAFDRGELYLVRQ